ncbi:MAG: RNA polymerase sigma factor [Eubacteriales bacterium]
MILLFTVTPEEPRKRNDQIEELIAKMATGDTASLGALYDLIKTDVFAYALSKTCNKQDAEDIMQDVFMRIYKCAKQYTPKGTPMAWIITIELNIIRRNFQLKSKNVSFDDNFENKASDKDFEKSTVNDVFLQEMMRTLNEDEREVIVMHTVSDMKFREIAKLTGKPLSTVLSKYNRAIKKLQLIAKEVR